MVVAASARPDFEGQSSRHHAERDAGGGHTAPALDPPEPRWVWGGGHTHGCTATDTAGVLTLPTVAASEGAQGVELMAIGSCVCQGRTRVRRQ